MKPKKPGAPAAASGIGLLLSLAVTACASAQPSTMPGASSAAGAEEVAAESPELGWHMRVILSDALRARDGLIEGDLVSAQRAAAKIAETDYARMLPATWQAGFGALAQHASALSIAPSLGAAAEELGRMALACGECHQMRAQGPGRTLTVPLPWEDPPESWDARMHRHQLGIAQMWDGLVLPSEAAWRSGTVTITRAPLSAPARAHEPVSAELQARIEVTRELATQARLATSYRERGRVFGELIAGCAQCHHLLRPTKAHAPVTTSR